jgi:hypothetical protein
MLVARAEMARTSHYLRGICEGGSMTGHRSLTGHRSANGTPSRADDSELAG